MTLAGEGLIHSDSEKYRSYFSCSHLGIPFRVIDFLNRLETDCAKYYFAVAVNAGQVAATLIQLKCCCKKRTLTFLRDFPSACPAITFPGAALLRKKSSRKNSVKRLDKNQPYCRVYPCKRRKKRRKKVLVGKMFSFRRFTAYLLLKFRKWINRF